MNLAVLASGSGTLLDAILTSGLPISVVGVDRTCRAEEVAAAHRVECIKIERDDFTPTFDREAYDARWVEALAPYDLDLIVMAGYGTILSEVMHAAYPHRILNTHPALLPSFKGWHGVRDALDYGVKVTGCTVHIATLGVDEGPILAQEAVPVLDDDDEASLHERIKDVERRLYVDTIRRVMENPNLLLGRRADATADPG